MSARHPASRSRPGRVARRAVLGALLVALLVVGGTAFRVWQVARADQRQAVDVSVVLGAAQYHGEPSDVLEARLKHALKLYEDGVTDHIMTVGGRKAGDTYTEAEAGKDWLVEHDVPASKIIDVETGSDTLGSIQAVAKQAHQRNWSSALIVSDPWHSLRSRTMASDMGLDAYASPARTGPVVQTREIQARYILRETAALLYYRLTHASAEINGAGLG